MKHIISMRETQVLHLIAHEFTNVEIADKLQISHHTAYTHRKNILHKLNVKNAAGLVRKAFELGLLSISDKQFEFTCVTGRLGLIPLCNGSQAADTSYILKS